MGHQRQIRAPGSRSWGATIDSSGGSCGLTPRPRCQPGSGAARSEPVFPTKREGPARRRRRHAMVAEALVPPGATRVAIRIATRVATVYTNAPKRRGGGHFHRSVEGAISTDLCTLLRPHGRSHFLARPNSVHKRPNPARRGRFRRSVYTIASSHLSTTAQQHNSVHKRPNPARRGPILPFVYTIAIPRPPTTQAHGATVYTNALKRHREAIFYRFVYTPASVALAVRPTSPGW